jgi:DNA-binding protein YbaB
VQLFDLDGLPDSVRDLGRSIQELAVSLGHARVRAEAADGEVVATTDMSGTLHQIDISARAVRELDNLTLADEVVKAIAGARENARQAYENGLGSIQLLGSTLGQLRGAPIPSAAARQPDAAGADLGYGGASGNSRW